MDLSSGLGAKILHAINDGVIIIDENGIIQWVNRFLTDLFGYSKYELLHQQLEILLPLNLRKKHNEYRLKYLQNPTERAMSRNIEFEGLRKDGTSVWVNIALSFYHEKGRHFSIAIVSDKTEKRSIEFHAKMHAQRAQLFFDLAKAFFLELDKNGFVIAINNEGCKILECQEELIIGKNWFDTFIDPKNDPKLKRDFQKLISSAIPQTEYINTRIITKSGHFKTIRWHNYLLTDTNGNGTGAICSGVDITPVEELKKAQTEAVLFGAENERKRVAVELHDGIVQMLTAISMNLKSIENSIPLLPEDDQNAYTEALKLTMDSISDTRAISHDLMPTALVRDGLVAALNDLAERTTKYHGILVTLNSDNIGDGLSELHRLNIYRVLQELIQNTVKHAEATIIKIILRLKAEKIYIKYQDDGRGFDDSIGNIQRNGFGLKNIITRIGYMNGQIKIISSVKSGTKVIAIIPESNLVL